MTTYLSRIGLSALLVLAAPAALAQGSAPGDEPSASPLEPDEPDTSAPSDPDGEAKRQERVDDADDESRHERLEALYERLANAENKFRADRIARNIQRRMLRSGSPTVDLLMTQAGKAIDEKKFGTSLDLLDSIVRLRPEFAEGWNRRATVYFMREDFGHSLADIERVLELEPRHWGALSGLAMILLQLDEDEEALSAIDAALAVHPYLEKLKDQREKLGLKLGGSDI